MPEGLARVTAGEVEVDCVEALPHPAPDLKEPETQGADLQVGDVEPRQPAPDGLQEPVGGTVQQELELVKGQRPSGY